MSAPVQSLQPTNPELRQHTPTPWAYRPVAFDDWGYIRGPKEPGDFHGPVVAIARGDSDKSHDEHRRDGTDPYGPNAAFIVEAVNSHATLKARAEQAERAVDVLEAALREAIAVFESWHDDETEVELLPQLRAALESKP